MPSISEDLTNESLKQMYHTSDYSTSQSINFKTLNEVGSSTNRVNNIST